MLPLLMFCSARAGRSFTPINYRLSAEGVRALTDQLREPLVVVDERYRDVVASSKYRLLTSEEFLTAAAQHRAVREFPDPDSVAVVLFTSGTTSLPKAVELSHNNLTSYVTDTVEFDSAAPDRRGADLRAALPHRRRRCGAVQPVRRPQDGVPAHVRRPRMGAAGQR